MENEQANNVAIDPKPTNVGGIVGAIIIIVLIVLGGWYFITDKVEKVETQKQQQAAANIDLSTGSSTEVADIQTDLNNLNLDALNQ